MRIWKRNAIVATVLLFVCAGIYLNWSYGSNVTDLSDTLDASLLEGDTELVMGDEMDLLTEAANAAVEPDTVTTAEYFSEIRLSRQEARDAAVNTLQEAMAYESDGDESVMTASQVQLESIVTAALQEAQIESLVIAKGYDDCVAYMNDDGISVAVAAPEGGLDAAAVAQIADIVCTQSDYGMQDLRVIEVS